MGSKTKKKRKKKMQMFCILKPTVAQDISQTFRLTSGPVFIKLAETKFCLKSRSQI